MESSVPQYFVLARKSLDEASAALAQPLDLEDAARAQATATVGLGYAVLATVQELAARR
jgi:hypothetical protein